MKIFKTLLSCFSVALLGSVTAFAAPIKLYPTGSGVGLASLGEETVTNWLKGEISYYNANNGVLADLPLLAADKTSSDLPYTEGNDDVKSILVNGLGAYDYIVLHWGNKGEDGFKNIQAYYLNGVSSFQFDSPVIEVPKKNGGTQEKQFGLSFYRLYAGVDDVPGVPDSASTLGLFGLAALALVGIARRRA